MTRERGSTFGERLFEHAVSVVLTAALIAIGAMIFRMDKEIAIVMERQAGIEKQLAIVTGHTQNRYTDQDAIRDRMQNDKMHDKFEERLRKLEVDHNRRPGFIEPRGLIAE